MGKMSELDRQRRELLEVCREVEVEELVKKEELVKNIDDTDTIHIPVYYSIDDETGITHYDTDSMRDFFDKEIKRLEDNTQAEVDGWNEKQQDYAMDSMA
jgi:hypothetical protein